MNRRTATLLRWLLVALLVIQPLQAAFAMSGMGMGEEPLSSPSAVDSHEMGTGCAHHLPAGGFHAESGDGQGYGALDDCCSTPACHVVGILSFLPSIQPAVGYPPVALTTPLREIVLSAERKPPRVFRT